MIPASHRHEESDRVVSPASLRVRTTCVGSQAAASLLVQATIDMEDPHPGLVADGLAIESEYDWTRVAHLLCVDDGADRDGTDEASTTTQCRPWLVVVPRRHDTGTRTVGIPDPGMELQVK